MNFPENLIFNYLMSLIANPNCVFPFFIWIIATWKVARLRNYGYNNYQKLVDDTVANTVKQEIGQKYLDPFFANTQIQLPEGHTSVDIVNIILGTQNETNLTLLSHIFNSFQQGHAEIYLSALDALLQLVIGL